MSEFFLPKTELQRLLDALVASGRECVGPVAQDGAIVFEPVTRAEQLPWGISDQQSPGSYRLQQTHEERCFGWANGPQAIKPLTFQPEEPLWSVRKDDQGLHFEAIVPDTRPTAILGVRACDLAALALQRKHFEDAGDAHFRKRREALLLIAVDCAHPASTCFCASTGDGPVNRAGYDIALAEINAGFLLRSASAAGQQIVDALNLPEATHAQLTERQQQEQDAVQAQSRSLPAETREVILQGQDAAHWANVAARCLACGNCTSVCPTCFCSNYESLPELKGQAATQQRSWDSCFSAGHSELHGHPVRDDIALRYRQWLTHKLANWYDQYGRSGCTGCGRCITWCPVGIDLTAEVAALAKEAMP